jgi:hypothetical protein
MFGFFKKGAAFPSAEELSRIGLAAGADVREKWVRFDSTVHFKVEVPLAQKIDLFVQRRILTTISGPPRRRGTSPDRPRLATLYLRRIHWRYATP